MNKTALILFVFTIASSLLSASIMPKSLFNPAISIGKSISGGIRNSKVSFTKKIASKSYIEECRILCKKYPAAEKFIMKNPDYFVSVTKRFGDSAVKHEVAYPGILKFGEDVFKTDGAKLLLKEDPETFFKLTKYFKKNPKLAGKYLYIYKIADKLATPKNILATGVGFGLFKVCFDTGASIKEFASDLSDVVHKVSGEHPIMSMLIIFSTIAAVIFAVMGGIKQLLFRIFRVKVCEGKK